MQSQHSKALKGLSEDLSVLVVFTSGMEFGRV